MRPQLLTPQYPADNQPTPKSYGRQNSFLAVVAVFVIVLIAVFSIVFVRKMEDDSRLAANEVREKYIEKLQDARKMQDVFGNYNREGDDSGLGRLILLSNIFKFSNFPSEEGRVELMKNAGKIGMDGKEYIEMDELAKKMIRDNK